MSTDFRIFSSYLYGKQKQPPRVQLILLDPTKNTAVITVDTNPHPTQVLDSATPFKIASYRSCTSGHTSDVVSASVKQKTVSDKRHISRNEKQVTEDIGDEHEVVDVDNYGLKNNVTTDIQAANLLLNITQEQTFDQKYEPPRLPPPRSKSLPQYVVKQPQELTQPHEIVSESQSSGSLQNLIDRLKSRKSAPQQKVSSDVLNEEFIQMREPINIRHTNQGATGSVVQDSIKQRLQVVCASKKMKLREVKEHDKPYKVIGEVQPQPPKQQDKNLEAIHGDVSNDVIVLDGSDNSDRITISPDRDEPALVKPATHKSLFTIGMEEDSSRNPVKKDQVGKERTQFCETFTDYVLQSQKMDFKLRNAKRPYGVKKMDKCLQLLRRRDTVLLDKVKDEAIDKVKDEAIVVSDEENPVTEIKTEVKEENTLDINEVVDDKIRCILKQAIMERRQAEGKPKIDIDTTERVRREVEKREMTAEELDNLKKRRSQNRLTVKKYRQKRKIEMTALNKAWDEMKRRRVELLSTLDDLNEKKNVLRGVFNLTAEKKINTQTVLSIKSALSTGNMPVDWIKQCVRLTSGSQIADEYFKTPSQSTINVTSDDSNPSWMEFDAASNSSFGTSCTSSQETLCSIGDDCVEIDTNTSYGNVKSETVTSKASVETDEDSDSDIEPIHLDKPLVIDLG